MYVDNCLVCSGRHLLVLGGAVLDSTPHTLSTSLETVDRCLAWTRGRESSLLVEGVHADNITPRLHNNKVILEIWNLFIL